MNMPDSRYGGGNISSPLFRELIVRWFQWGAFCPLFRNHGSRRGGPDEGDNSVCGGTGGSNEIWEFGNESEAAIARVMRIREQLRPYVMEQVHTQPFY
jgi:alpha-D-xyloside xylohydrolase